MVNMLDSSAVDHEFELWPGQTKDYIKIAASLHRTKNLMNINEQR